jgi:hypothetical protein
MCKQKANLLFWRGDVAKVRYYFSQGCFMPSLFSAASYSYVYVRVLCVRVTFIRSRVASVLSQL